MTPHIDHASQQRQAGRGIAAAYQALYEAAQRQRQQQTETKPDNEAAQQHDNNQH
jgi:hypothetical protein